MDEEHHDYECTLVDKTMDNKTVRQKCAEWVGWSFDTSGDWGIRENYAVRSEADLAEAVRVKTKGVALPSGKYTKLSECRARWGYRNPIENMRAVVKALDL